MCLDAGEFLEESSDRDELVINCKSDANTQLSLHTSLESVVLQGMRDTQVWSVCLGGPVITGYTERDKGKAQVRKWESRMLGTCD